jgi:tRNA(adenine34) deaminase
MGLSGEAFDRAMMARCVELSTAAIRQGEYPFAALIALDGRIVAEAINRSVRDNDVCRHAETIALSHAQRTAGRMQLPRATLYSTVEPCAMCSFCIREAWVGRVVYALSSPVMGGASKWNILRDRDISSRAPIFGPAPEVVSGVAVREARDAWRAWNPVAWEMARLRGVLTAEGAQDDAIRVAPAHSPSVWRRLIMAYFKLSARAKPVPAPIPPQRGADT